MESLVSFMPLDRQDAVARRVGLPDRTFGSALFVDISGFTPLTDAFARLLGPRLGAEEMTRHLNLVYDPIIAQVHHFGGNVIGFSGDAVTCWFDHDSGAAATAAAFAVHAAIDPVSTITLASGEVQQLGVKAAVATGETRRFLVGDPEIQVLDVLAGRTVERLAAAEHLAQRGEVVVDASTAEALAGALDVLAWRTDPESQARFAVAGHFNRSVDVVPTKPCLFADLIEDEVRSWIPAPVYQRMRSGHEEYLAEIRPAVALFMQFGGIAYDDDPQAGQKLDGFVRHVQTILTRYEGFLVQLTIGDKGSYLYASFGAPISHDDDALRAAAVARKLAVSAEAFDFITFVKIGISQGLVRSGPYGSQQRRTYGIQGEDVNLAARLMQLAKPGQIVVSRRVMTRARRGHAFRELGFVTVKGVAKPVPIAELLLADAPISERELDEQLRGRIYGRDEERSLLREMLARMAESGASSVVVLTGEAGIGKSRLVADLLASARDSGVRCLGGAGDAIERITPYFVWRSVFADVLDLGQAPGDPAGYRSYVAAHLAGDPEMSRVAPLLNVILPAELPENELTEQMSGQVRASNTLTLLLRLLQHAADKTPLVLAIEDAHWLDSNSWALVAAVAQQVSPMLLVLTTRPLGDTVVTEFDTILQNPQTVTITVQPLNAVDLLALVSERLDVGELPPDVGELILRKAEGHPFFSQELALALRDSGMIVCESGRCVVGPGIDLDAIVFPDTVEGVVTGRIDRLAPAHQMTLKVASVVGRIFAHRTLRDIYPVAPDRENLVIYLDHLDRLNLTPLYGRDPLLQYGFQHAITHEVAYGMLLFSQRRELHRCIAEWYEQTNADDLTAYYPILAYHWRQALGERPDSQLASHAIDYLEKAGEQAIRSYANLESINYFQDLLRIADANPELAVSDFRRGTWEVRLAEAYMGLGKLADSEKHFDLGLTLYGYPPPLKLPALAGNLARNLAVQLAHRARPSHFLNRAGDQSDRLLAVSDAMQQESKIFFYKADSSMLLYSTLQGLNLAEAAGPSAVLARNYGTVCAISGLLSLHRFAVPYGELALETARQVNDLPAEGWVNLATGLYYVGVGNWPTARRLLDRAMELFEHLGDRRQWEEACSVTAPSWYWTGDFDRSIEYRRKAYLSARERGDPQVQIWGVVGEAQCLVRQGDTASAVALLERNQALLRESEDSVWFYGVLALACWQSGARSSAIRAAAQGAQRLGKYRPTAAQVVDGYAFLAELFLDAWEAGDDLQADGLSSPQEMAGRALKSLATFAKTFPVGQPSLLRLQGVNAWLAGNKSKANKLWQHSNAEARRLEMPYEAARALFEAGRHTGGAAGETQLAEAAEIFERIGAVSPR